MTGTETRIREALVAVADRRPVDVERLWQEFQPYADVATPVPARTGWFVPLAAAASILLILGLVVVGRAQLNDGGRAPSHTPSSSVEFSLDQLPPWENGAPATTFPLPTPASTPIAFDVEMVSHVPAVGHSRIVVYYADNPSRLCVVEIFRPDAGAEHTVSIACDPQAGYVRNPVTRGTGWILGTVPQPATKVEVTADWRSADVEMVTRAGMPRPVFFAQFAEAASLTDFPNVEWRFVDAEGRTVGQGPDATPTPPARTGDPAPFRATPTGETATFDEPPSKFDPAGSHRVLHIYWAGAGRGFCSNEQLIRPGKSPQTTSEDCGATFSEQVTSIGQWLPADESGGGSGTATFWGVMPPRATKTVIVTARGQVPVPSAQPTGMPTGVYAGSIDVSDSPAAVLYFLDSGGRVVAAATNTFFRPPPVTP